MSIRTPTQWTEKLDDLSAAMIGEVITRSHPVYEQARKVWNGLIDRHPAAVARCTSTADVVEVVRFARKHQPLVSIRGGGHQIAGSAVLDDGLVIDLSAMKGIHVDPDASRVRAQGGVTWGELDRATQLFGLATNGGEVSTTGIAGFTLGGGMGLLMRAYGLACDTLRSIEMVTADGHVLTASRERHPDLFWAARGGGRGLGVVTSFEFDLCPLGPEVAFAQVFYPWEAAEEILRTWPELALSSPEAVSPELALWSIPPDPAIPQELHGRPTVIAQAVYAGAKEEAEETLAPFRQLATPLLDVSGVAPYVELQSALDPLFPAGGRCYMKSHFMDELPAEAVPGLLEWSENRPTPESLVVLRTLGGAVGRVAPEESAFPHRTAPFNLSIDSFWTDPSLDEASVGWARKMWKAMEPYATGGVYVNFSGLGDEADELRGRVYGGSGDRLAEVRARYDPDGLFTGAALRP